MFTLAVLIGIYSYLLMGLGLVGWLTKEWISVVTLGCLLGFLYNSPLRPSLKLREGTGGRVTFFLLSLIVIQAIVNLVGALGPERGFDALWYHLPIPRMWLASHRIFFIGGNLYYSAMPKLIDMLYVWGETPAKLMHLAFGLLATAVTYKLARKWLEQKWAMLAAVIFYSNLVVGWQSITAYIDLGRTFFEVLAFYLLVEKKIYKSAIVLGLAIATKLLALGSLPIMLILLWVQKRSLKMSIAYFLISIFVSLPWLIFAWISTGNPVYPVFSGYKLEWDWTVNLLRLADPINPIYVVAGIWLLVHSSWFIAGVKKYRLLFAYCGLSFVVWFLTPRTGGGRFLLPYLPAWSVATAVIIAQRSARSPQKFLIGIVIAIAVISIGYRAVANVRFLEYLIK